MYLECNNNQVAFSVDDGNWVMEAPDANDDNLSLSLFYKGQVDYDCEYQLFAKALPFTHKIKEDQLQISYKTYGVGHELTVYNA